MVFTKKFDFGEDEGRWWAEATQIARQCQCSLTSYRGELWPKSAGRELVYSVSGSKEDIVLFKLSL